MKAKIIILFLSVVVVVACLYIVNYCNCKQPEPVKRGLKSIIPHPINADFLNKESMPLEDRLKLSVVEVSSEDAEKSVEDVPGFLKIGNVSLSLAAAEIDTDAVNMLMDKADKLTCAACTRSVLALRITYGVVSGALKLYYTPMKVCFLSKGSPAGGIQECNNYKVCKEGQDYVYNGGDKFSDADAGEKNQAIIDYAKAGTGFRIRRKEASGVFDNFHAGSTFFDDGTSLIFSFQQIKKIFSKTPGIRTVKLWNALGVFPIDPATQYPDPVLKHILLFSVGDVTYAGNDLRVTPKPFSNLAHICPPDCNIFGFITAPHL